MTSNNLKSLYLFINKTNGCIKDNNGNRHSILIPTDDSRSTLKKYKELKRKKQLIWLINNNSDHCNKEYIKIKFNSDENLTLKKY